MIITGVIIALATLIGLFVNAGRISYLWLKMIFSSLHPIPYGVIYAVIVILILVLFILSRVPGIGIPRIVFRVGHYALGFLIYMMMIVNVAALLLFLLKQIQIIPVDAYRLTKMYTGGFSLILIVVISIYGIIHAKKIFTTHYTVQLGQPKEGTDSLKITLVSDIHLGYVIEEPHLAKIVTAVNETRPDIVCLAGDIFDGDITSLSNSKKLQDLFKNIKSNYGVYACLGNHDAGSGYEGMINFLTDAGVKVLQDDTVVIDNRILLVSRKDSTPIGKQGEVRKENFEIPKENTLPVIVIDHQPGNIGEYRSDTDLILCGHTHKGQMLPFNFVTKAAFDVDYGYFRANDAAPHVIVTSGAGTWGPPQRVGTKNEIAKILLFF